MPCDASFGIDCIKIQYTLKGLIASAMVVGVESIHPQALLAQVLERANLQRALKQVRQNKGAPGIDGMSVDELPDYLRHHWPEIRAQLEAGHRTASFWASRSAATELG
ncbi:hypothetical protein JKG41_04240 [Acidithiobacillus sp. MC2.1]|nr:MULTISPECIES: hypothetical protein [Acidithiobacillus]MBN6744288.1 hypothetical protein [Acidithiobacillus sp. MC2.2]MBU2775167.1 hypothetical protein [Acidithiobacillus ferrooxidans]MCR1344600.1 hypothetical protein [Acidithiobacillus ferrooxidans]MCR1355014.1 hypothetical protein [Acidithiobacillus ferrooxidans]